MWFWVSDIFLTCIWTLVVQAVWRQMQLTQWRAEVWWCPGRLLAWMPPYQILVLSSGIWWSLLLDIHCLWRHNMTSYSHLQTNVLAKFVDTTCIFRDAGAGVGKQSCRHGGPFVGLDPTNKAPSHSQIELWSTINRWSFYQISECQDPLIRRKAPYWKLSRDGSVGKGAH